MVDEFAAAEEHISVIPHPLQAVTPTSRPPGAMPTFLFFGSLRANKGLDTLLAAIERMPPDVARFIVAGGGNAELANKVNNAARVLPHLSCELGYINDDRKEALFPLADVLVPPYSEDFLSRSGVLFDAYAYGVPVIVTDGGAIGATVKSDATAGWRPRTTRVRCSTCFAPSRRPSMSGRQ